MGEMNKTRPHWSSLTKLVVSLLLVTLFVYLLFRFSIILTPLILAVIVAYVLSPVVNLLQSRLKLRRSPATLLTYLAVLVVLFTLPVLIAPPLGDQITELTQDLQRFLAQAGGILERQFVIAGQVIDLQALFKPAIGSLQGVAEPFIGQTLGILMDVISSVAWVIFIVVISLYLVKDGPRIREWFEGQVPLDYRSDFIRLREEISQVWSAFFRGQLLLALVVAAIFVVIGFILGLPFALAMGLLAGLLEFLPSLGHGIWLVCAAILSFFFGSTWIPIPHWAFAVIVIGLHLVYQQFDLNYLIPRIVGRRVNLPPLVVILGIVAGAVLAGVLGILLAAPTIASTRVIGRYLYANLFDLDPFPASPAPPLSTADPQWWKKPSER